MRRIPSLSMQVERPIIYGCLLLRLLIQQGPNLHSSAQGEDMGPCYPKDHNQREPKHRRDHRGLPNPLPGLLPGFLFPRQASIITSRHHLQGEVACFIVRRRQCPLVPCAHQYHRLQHYHNSGHQERQKNSTCGLPTEGPTMTPIWPANPDSDVTFWREWNKFRVWWVARKLVYKIGQHAVTQGPHTRTPTYAQDCIRQSRLDNPPIEDIHPARQAQP